jgi:hypothetical protein
LVFKTGIAYNGSAHSPEVLYSAFWAGPVVCCCVLLCAVVNRSSALERVQYRLTRSNHERLISLRQLLERNITTFFGAPTECRGEALIRAMKKLG